LAAWRLQPLPALAGLAAGMLANLLALNLRGGANRIGSDKRRQG